MQIKLVTENKDKKPYEYQNIIAVQEDDDSVILALADKDGKSNWRGEDCFLRLKLNASGDIRVIQMLTKSGRKVKFDTIPSSSR